MELDMLIRSALSDAQWLIAKGGTDRAEVLNRVLGKIDNVLKELDGVELIDLNKVWLDGKLVGIYPSLHEIQRSFGYIRCNVRQCCEGNRKQSYGFKWKYLN